MELQESCHHYRRWSWVLHFGLDLGAPEIGMLWKALDEDRQKYHRFARNITTFCSALSVSSPPKCNVTKFGKKFNVYFNMIGYEIREDVRLFLECGRSFGRFTVILSTCKWKCYFWNKLIPISVLSSVFLFLFFFQLARNLILDILLISRIFYQVLLFVLFYSIILTSQ